MLLLLSPGGVTTTTSPTGSVTPTGTVRLTTTKVLTGTATPTGTATRTTTKLAVGAVTPTGAVIRNTSKLLSGAVAPTGILLQVGLKYILCEGSVTPVGALVKSTSKLLEGSVTPTGAIAKLISKRFTGVLAVAGSLITSLVPAVPLAYHRGSASVLPSHCTATLLASATEACVLPASPTSADVM